MPTATKKKLNPSNYYEHWTDHEWLSPTVFKGFVACEAQELAIINDEWKPDNAQALLVGNWLHSYFESDEAHRKFIEENRSAVTTKSGKSFLQPFKQADDMINRLKREPMFKGSYVGEKEVIITGELFGVPWKGKIDCLNVEQGYFIDLKTTRNIDELYWNQQTRERENFIIYYDYPLQMAVYKRLLENKYGKTFKPMIWAVSKEKHPDIRLFGNFSESRLADEFETIQAYQEHVLKVIQGDEEPTRCGHCDYCKDTHLIDSITPFDQT